MKNEQKFLDYTIGESSDGIVVVKDHCNVVPGACVHKSFDEAKISAIKLFMISRPKQFEGSIFWRMEGREGAMHEFFTLKKILEKEKIPMPNEISAIDISCLIGFKGKII